MTIPEHGNKIHSMDWFKGQLKPEPPIFNGKIYKSMVSG